MNGWLTNAWLCLALGAVLALWGCSDEDSSAEQAPAVEQPDSPSPAAPGPGDQPQTTTTPQEFYGNRGFFLSTFFAEKYIERCSGADGDERECEVLHGLVVVETVLALQEIQASRDQRGTEEALASLDIVDEPEIHIAAMRILGQFPETPGVGEKVLPLLLESPWLMVQQTAAEVLINMGIHGHNTMLATIGSLWNGNHLEITARSEYEEYPDFPPHYFDMGFPEYENAEWFSPLDSDRSIGWSTPDDAAAVAQWYGEQLDAEVIDAQAFAERMFGRQAAEFPALDESKMQRMQELMEEWARTQDMALLEEVERLQAEIQAPAQAAGEAAEQSPEMVALAPGEYHDSTHYIVAEERDGQTARLVLVYRLPELERTVIQHAWSLAFYPSAWPQTPGDDTGE